jgi:hypothetical protein
LEGTLFTDSAIKNMGIKEIIPFEIIGDNAIVPAGVLNLP